ncbi:MAG: isocitrate lyase/phosphoenolpyruvate mutase family protein [Coxiellaceae bacterium]|nr:isocitrate lyase/phosphoenolpyruvate mutase family protein [Coxiellaceae bacterium]
MTLKHRLLPAKRRKLLRDLLASKPGIRIIEAHNGLSGVIGATAATEDEQGNTIEFDGLWVSSLTDSAAKAHPDTEVIDTSSRLLTIQEILQVTDKPIIVDGDTGGQPTQFEYFCSKLENLGVSAVVIEDKRFPKRNSLEVDATHILEDPHVFAQKINRAKEACLSDDFMIFTRIESFIANRGLDDAVARADIYLDSKADGVFIHSNKKNADQVLAFVEIYKELCKKKGVNKPLIAVPTTYNTITDEELFAKGFNIVIYANHQLRAAQQAMQDACQSILSHKRSTEISQVIAPVKQVMEVVGYFDVKDTDAKFVKDSMPAILLASGKPVGFADTDLDNLAISAIPVDGKTLLERQLAKLKNAGLSDVTVVTGYCRETVPENTAKECYNEDFAKTGLLHSLMMAARNFQDGFMLIFGDIYFSKHLLRYLLKVDGDMLLMTDNSFNLRTRQSIKSTTDLVTLEHDDENLRRPKLITEKVLAIGNNLPLDQASHEFIGVAKFSAKGAKQLLDQYEAMEKVAMQTDDGLEELYQLDFNTMLQSMIDNNCDVRAVEVSQGWAEVHNLTDVATIEKMINRGKHNKQSTATVY